MSYPKWVGRGYGLGDVLCASAEEESAVMADNEARQKAADDAAAELDAAKKKAADDATAAEALAAQQAAEDADAQALTEAEELVHKVTALRAQLDDAGIAYNKRWREARLQALLPA